MELTIQSVNFDASEQLKAFVEKKIKKLQRFSDDIIQAEVILRVVKPETHNNKDASVKLLLRNSEAFARRPTPLKKRLIYAVALENRLSKARAKRSGKFSKKSTKFWYH